MTRKTLLGLVLAAYALRPCAPCWALESSGFLVDTGSPDALCPDLSQTRAAVARRLGALVVEGRGGWHARYTIGHAPSAANRDFVRLELFAPDNTLELQRDLPMAGETCATMAEVIALVLDRHFRGLGEDESRAPEAAPTAPAPKAEATSGSPPSARSPTAAQQPQPVERAPIHTKEVIAQPAATGTHLTRAKAVIGAGLAEGFARRAPLLSLRALGRIHPRVLLGGELEVQLKPARLVLASGGEVRAVAGGTRAFVAWSLPLYHTLAYAGPSAAFRLEQGESRDLPQTQRQLRGVWAAGLQAGWFAPISGPLLLQVAANADFTLSGASGRFYVAGNEVLRPPAFELALGLGLSHGFW